MPMNLGPYGTNADGTKSEDYCAYCYTNGQFNAPNMTMEEMINVCIPHVVNGNKGMDEKKARELMEQTLPQLKRWKND